MERKLHKTALNSLLEECGRRDIFTPCAGHPLERRCEVENWLFLKNIIERANYSISPLVNCVHWAWSGCETLWACGKNSFRFAHSSSRQRAYYIRLPGLSFFNVYVNPSYLLNSGYHAKHTERSCTRPWCWTTTCLVGRTISISICALKMEHLPLKSSSFMQFCGGFPFFRPQCSALMFNVVKTP